MKIRKIKDDEMPEALALVWQTFLDYEASDYTEDGILEFKKTISDPNWIKDKSFFGAFENKKLLGVIATKDETHIALFFVDGAYHRQGIGKKLYQKVAKINQKEYFTVNSSPYAKEIYKHLGFTSTSEMQIINGLKFYPMKSILKEDR